MPSLLLALLFSTPWAALLTAAGAASVPVVIHLLNRHRYRVVTWAAMRFLLAAQRKNTRRMRLEQLLLLLVRTALVLLLVLAMAAVSPWAEEVWQRALPGGTALAGPVSRRTHKVLVIDGSFSMAARLGDGGTCFDRARAVASRIVRDAPAGDAFSVVLMSAPPRRVVPEPSDDAAKVTDEIKALRLPQGNSDFAGTLAAVADLLRPEKSPGKFEEREVYWITDLQRATWRVPPGAGPASALEKIKGRARSIFVDVGQDGLNNLAVTGLTLAAPLATTGAETAFTATVHNYGAEPRKGLRVDFLVGRARSAASDPPLELRQAREKLIDVGPGQAEAVTFNYKFSAPGDYAVQVRIEGDVLDLDDLRSAVVSVKDTVPVLVVNGKPAADPFGRASEWLATALNPFQTVPPPGNVPARPRTVELSEFHDVGRGDLTPYDCVFLCDVNYLDAAEVRRLENHLRQGGGVVIALGPDVDLERYNRLLYRDGEGLLPARLVGTEQAPEGRSYVFYADEEGSEKPPLSAFTGNDRAALLAARIRKYVRVEMPAHGRARRILSFMPDGQASDKAGAPVRANDPALVEWPKFRGRVVLLTTTVNLDWTSWPLSPSFPALTQELFHFSIGGRLREQAAVVGEPLEHYLPLVSGGLDATVVTPEGKEAARTEEREDAAVLRWADTDVAGLYRASVGRDWREHVFAVNVPTASEGQQACESDLGRVNRDELRSMYPGWDFQVVSEPGQVVHAQGPPAEEATEAAAGAGTAVARYLLLTVVVLLAVEVVLAWRFGHYRAAGVPGTVPASGRLVPGVVGGVAGVVFVGLALVLGHAAWTGDFGGFLPEGVRRGVEGALGIPAAAPGEGTRWRLEFSPYLRSAAADPWVAGLAAVGLAGLVVFLYLREGRTAGTGYKLLLSGLRVYFILLALAVLLPQLRLWFERQSWPDVAVLVDVSGSVSTTDPYQDPKVREAADALAREAGGLAAGKARAAAEAEREAAEREARATEQQDSDARAAAGLREEAARLRRRAAELRERARVLEKATQGQDLQRLELAQVLLTRKVPDWLEALLSRRKVKVHLYAVSGRADRVADVTDPRDAAEKAEAVRRLQAPVADGESSQLGSAVKQVLNDFRGSSLAAVVMLTDGVTTEGDDLLKASKHASKAGVPLFFVGLGESKEVKDLKLHDLQVEDAVYVNDRVVFEARLTAQGFAEDLTVPVTLKEKGKDRVLDTQMVKIDPTGKPAKVRLHHQPKEPGEKVYVLEVPVQGDEPAENNRIERTVFVRDTKLIKVLYVEGPYRWEYQKVKTLLERESAAEARNKTIDLKVLLLSADEDWARQDKSAITDFPTKLELNQFDLVIFGDVDPHDVRVEKHLGDVADFVRERGGGFLMIAGEAFGPQAYKDTALRDVLPVEVVGPVPEDREREEGYRPELTPAGRFHPIFRFSPDEAENVGIWNGLRELYWYSEGYRAKWGAEVLAVHPTKPAEAPRGDEPAGPAGDPRHPLVVQQFVGNGRVMFFGFNETWRWGFREDVLRFNQFWIQTVRYLSRSRLGRVELRLDRQAPYRRGAPIRVTVRFPDDVPPPAADVPVQVRVVRTLARPGAAPETEEQTLALAKVEGSRATYEAILTRTPEGDYVFQLSAPAVEGQRPRAEAKVIAPPGEKDRLRMNRQEMERAAEETQGHFYTLAEADRLLEDLPVGTRIALNTPQPPRLIWNHGLVFALGLGLLSAEWFLRKRKHLL